MPLAVPEAPLSANFDEIARWAQTISLYLQATAKNPELTTLSMEVLHNEPERLFEGLIACADGTDWNPGSGAGLYLYIGSAWTKL